jgi:glycosyltransferase involved in cell wall biosynthesis
MNSEHRILSLDPAGLLWGSERALLDFIGRLPACDTAVCCPPDTPLLEKLAAIGIPAYPTFQANLHQRGICARLIALAGLLRALRAFRPHVLHVNQAGTARIALAACNLLRIPCVVHVRLREDVDYLARLRPSDHWLRCMVAISQPIADLIALRPELSGIPCRLLIDAYEMVNKPGATESSPAADREWDFICVGRFCESKGQHLLIEALAKLHSLGIAFKTLFVGAINEHAAFLRLRAVELGLGNSIDFHGHSDAVGSLITSSRWLVCPSKFEPLGRVIFEGLDHGAPVIASARSGGAAASVQSSGGGLLFNEWTAESLAQTLKQAAETESQQKMLLAATGRDWLAQATDPDRYASAMAGIFRDASQVRSSRSS